MIGEALGFIKNQLNEYLKPISGQDGTQPDPVEFISGEHLDPLTFKSGAVSILLVNLEEEHTLRSPEPFRRGAPNGTQQSVHPEIRLNLFVLFVARYPQYEDALSALSHVIGYFQGHRVFTHTDAPALSDNIERLAVELITLPFAQQTEVWSALRVAYQPSVLYKLKLVVFQDDAAAAAPEIGETAIRLSV